MLFYHTFVNSSLQATILAVANNIKCALVLRLSLPTPTEAIATLLDPRFKTLHFWKANISQNAWEGLEKEYTTLKGFGSGDDILHWWKAQRDVMPVLAKLAQKYLSIPATSVPSESLFSAAGIISGGRRGNTSPKKLKEMAFLHRNRKYY